VSKEIKKNPNLDFVGPGKGLFSPLAWVNQTIAN